jgi:hypothetical protein
MNNIGGVISMGEVKPEQENQNETQPSRSGKYKSIPFIIRVYPGMAAADYVSYVINPGSYSDNDDMAQLLDTALRNSHKVEEQPARDLIDKKLRNPDHKILIGGREARGKLIDFLRPNEQPSSITDPESGQVYECYIRDYRVALPHELGKRGRILRELYSL